MAKAEDFKTSDKVGNSLFKGAAFHKNDKAVDKSRPQNVKGDNGVDFGALPDEEKECWHYVADKYIPNIKDPAQWAKEEASKSGLNAKLLAKAAKRYQQDSSASENVEKYPWWSAARDWSPEEIGAVGQKMAKGFRFSPEMASVVADTFRR